MPSEMIEELRQAGDKHALDVGVEIAVRTIKADTPLLRRGAYHGHQSDRSAAGNFDESGSGIIEKR